MSRPSHPSRSSRRDILRAGAGLAAIIAASCALAAARQRLESEKTTMNVITVTVTAGQPPTTNN